MKEIGSRKRIALRNISKIVPVDKRDTLNYVDDIYIYFRRTESKYCVNPNYMNKHTNINHHMRTILIDWLVEVHLHFKLLPEIMFLTVSIIDRFLERKQVSREKLQLVGVTAMFLASKYEDINCPEVSQFANITANAYTINEILRMEKIILRVLQYQLTVPTSNKFLNLILKGSTITKLISSYLIERTLQEIEMLKYCPSMIAASALFIAKKKVGQSRIDELEYNENDMRQCVDDILFHVTNRNSSFNTVKKKYGNVDRFFNPV